MPSAHTAMQTARPEDDPIHGDEPRLQRPASHGRRHPTAARPRTAERRTRARPTAPAQDQALALLRPGIGMRGRFDHTERAHEAYGFFALRSRPAGPGGFERQLDEVAADLLRDGDGALLDPLARRGFLFLRHRERAARATSSATARAAASAAGFAAASATMRTLSCNSARTESSTPRDASSITALASSSDSRATRSAVAGTPASVCSQFLVGRQRRRLARRRGGLDGLLHHLARHLLGHR